MRLKSLFAAGAATIAILASAPALATVTFDYAQISDYASASVGAYRNGGGIKQKSGSKSHSNYATSLPATGLSSTARYTASVIGATASGSSSSSLAFTSADQGIFTFAGSSSATVTAPATSDGSTSYASASAYNNGSYYYFTIDTASTIDLDFTASGYNTTYGDEGAGASNYYYLYNTTNGSYYQSEYVYGTDTRSFDLDAGSYQFGAYSYYYYYNNNYSSQSDVGTQSAAYNSTVAFDITPDVLAARTAAIALPAAVPEPASWAMMIGGVGVLGGVIRRSRRTVTVRFA